ncbi:zinc finger BED domain-containing protein 4-like [Haematobia irritans]|uniref:zinc finger BED domain-containing protein 4-like n=1 Tax=Haematobia irritans TaxID=7368 RepID=UPI003F50D1DE
MKGTAAFLKEVVEKFEIANKVTAIVSGNDANITAAIRLGQWRPIGCFAHSLNLVVQAALKEIDVVLTKVKRIVEYFHKSSQALKKLLDTQKQMQLPELKLKQDVATRWNSTYDMLQRIHVVKDAVIATLSLTRPELMLPLEDWDLIKEVIPILKPFYEVTIEISAEKCVTLSKVTLMCKILEGHMSKCTSENNHVIAMLLTIRSYLNNRFGGYEKQVLYSESTILDPRFKKLGFKNASNYENAVKILRANITKITLPDSNNREETHIIETNDNVDTNDFWSDFDKKFTHTVRPESNSAAAIREFDKYLNEEYLDRRKDPLDWCR